MSRAIVGIALAAAVAATPACPIIDSGCDFSFGRKWDPEQKVVVHPPDLDMLVGDTVNTSLADYYEPAECLEVWGVWDILLVPPSGAEAVAVSVSAEHVLTTVAVDVVKHLRVLVGTEPHNPAGHGYLDFHVSVAPR
ncbi:MAG: hypothetical protein OXU64_13290 [Gemmatimonadota bacterium]|nr:hypothetical protein [Gemmatimonadota bacterium]